MSVELVFTAFFSRNRVFLTFHIVCYNISYNSDFEVSVIERKVKKGNLSELHKIIVSSLLIILSACK